MSCSLGPQSLVLLGGSSTFRRWDLVEISRWPGMVPLKGLLWCWGHPVSPFHFLSFMRLATVSIHTSTMMFYFIIDQSNRDRWPKTAIVGYVKLKSNVSLLSIGLFQIFVIVTQSWQAIPDFTILKMEPWSWRSHWSFINSVNYAGKQQELSCVRAIDMNS